MAQAASFYSILVRLKGEFIRNEIEPQMFLFHTGSIKSQLFIPTHECIRLFLFHTGSIKSLEKPFRVGIQVIGFYSILVRLKVRCDG